MTRPLKKRKSQNSEPKAQHIHPLDLNKDSDSPNATSQKSMSKMKNKPPKLTEKSKDIKLRPNKSLKQINKPMLCPNTNLNKLK